MRSSRHSETPASRASWKLATSLLVRDLAQKFEVVPQFFALYEFDLIEVGSEDGHPERGARLLEVVEKTRAAGGRVLNYEETGPGGGNTCFVVEVKDVEAFERHLTDWEHDPEDCKLGS